MTDVSAKFIFACKGTKVPSRCRRNRPVARYFCAPASAPQLSAGTSFVCFNSVQGGVHFKNSPDLMESQWTGRPAIRSLADVPTISNDITHTPFSLHSRHILPGPYFPVSSCCSLMTLIIKLDFRSSAACTRADSGISCLTIPISWRHVITWLMFPFELVDTWYSQSIV